jgi:spermidine synthase
MDEIKNDELYNLLINNKKIFDDILINCNNSFELGSGSYLFDGKNYNYYFGMYKKQKLLFDLVKNCTSVLEIGTYMGHSLFIMLLSNPKLDIVSIDIDDKYSVPSINVLNSNFEQNIKFIKGNSLNVLDNITEKFDLIHIDGNHDESFILEEFEKCKKNARGTYKVLFDDVISMPNVENHILKNYKILNYIKPDCEWNNCFFEIELK